MCERCNRLPTPDELRRLLVTWHPMVSQAWSDRTEDSDILLFLDARLPEYRDRFAVEYGEELTSEIIASAEMTKHRPMLAFTEPRMYLARLAWGGLGEAAGQLRVIPPSGSVGGPPYVPVLARFLEGDLVGRWCPPGQVHEISGRDYFSDFTTN
ncbi:MAG: hypothetical protein ACYC1I_11720 [Acidimicrobiales bacterium]